MIDRIFQAALSADPPLVLPLPQVEKHQGTEIIKILVPKGLPYVYNLEGRYFHRIGNQTQSISPSDLRRLLMERGVVQFESRTPKDATIDDLDLNLITDYVTTMRFSNKTPVEEILIQRGCLKLDVSILRPTYAGILLFGKNPQQWLPSTSIMAARFPGKAFSDEFIKQDISGTLSHQINQSEVFVRDNLRKVVRLTGLARKETYEYPLEAIRELLVNAVAHRDYNMQGDCIHLHIFSDRLEVHSPGGLPGPINLDNLLEARFSRNPVIAQVLSDLGFIERLGYGLNRVLTVLKTNELPPPIFKEIGGSFRVILQNSISEFGEGIKTRGLSKYLNYDLNPRQEIALGYLATSGRITSRKYHSLCPEVSTETLRRDLVDLVKKGILIKIGDKKTTYYICKQKVE
jgi:ATP-dependent DNA helicase RecG